MSVDIDEIVVSSKFKYNNQKFKYFIGYLEGGIVKPLCIILPQMSGHIKYFENGVINMSFFIKDNEVWEEYQYIWNVMKDKQSIEFHSKAVFEYKFLKAKVREFNGVIKTNFLGNDMPKENMHYTCIACITIDSVMNFDKKNHLQVYLEECKYRVQKTQISRFISTELKSDSESDSVQKKEELQLILN